MKKPAFRSIALIVCLVCPAAAQAQQSASFKLQEFAINNGGHPADGLTLASASFRLSFGALGEGFSAAGLSSPARRMDACFVATYAPPGEVENLRLSDATTLNWDPERSVGRYNLYRGLLSAFPGGTYGSCQQSAIIGETATDAANPVSGQGFFYIVTAENRLAEEGTKGFDSSGSELPNPAPCP